VQKKLLLSSACSTRALTWLTEPRCTDIRFGSLYGFCHEVPLQRLASYPAPPPSSHPLLALAPPPANTASTALARVARYTQSIASPSAQAAGAAPQQRSSSRRAALHQRTACGWYCGTACCTAVVYRLALATRSISSFFLMA
jgi:hypothetical protein